MAPSASEVSMLIEVVLTWLTKKPALSSVVVLLPGFEQLLAARWIAPWKLPEKSSNTIVWRVQLGYRYAVHRVGQSPGRGRGRHPGHRAHDTAAELRRIVRHIAEPGPRRLVIGTRPCKRSTGRVKRAAVPDRNVRRVVDEHRRKDQIPALHELDTPARFRRVPPQVGLIGRVRCRRSRRKIHRRGHEQYREERSHEFHDKLHGLRMTL